MADKEREPGYDINPEEIMDDFTGKKPGFGLDVPDRPPSPEDRFNADGESTVVETFEGAQPMPSENIVPEPATATTEKGKTRGRPPATDVFKNLIPPSDRLFVYKITPKGEKGYVGNYSQSDLNRCQGIEIFISDYIVPTWGPGDYVVEQKDSNGKLKRHGLVPIPVPLTSQKEQNVMPSLSDIMNVYQQAQAQADKKSGDQMSNMMGMMSMFEKFMPKGEKGSGDSSLMMMMPMIMMMMQMQKPAGPDPVMQLLLQKLSHMEQQPQLPPPIPLPFPPAPPSEQVSGTGMVEMLKALAELSKMGQPQQQNQSTLLEAFITSILPKITQPDRNSLTAKDIIELIPKFKDMANPREGVSTFNDYLEGLMKLDEIRGGSSEGPSIFAGLAEMIAGVIRDIKLQQMQLEAYQKGIKVSEISQARQQMPQFRPTAPPVAQIQKLQQEPEERQSKVPQIPVSFRKYVVEMNNTYRKGEYPKLVFAYLKGLLHLREKSEEWKKYVEEMLLAAAEGDKARTLRFSEVFLYSFAKKKLLAPEVVAITKKLFEDQYEVIVKETGLDKALKVIEGEVEPVQTEQDEAPQPAEAVEIEEEEAEDDEVDLADYQQEGQANSP